ncbi:MAG: TonB-dependent receptor plug domain-containing protein, partial [Steroidobacteraceae bacterium]
MNSRLYRRLLLASACSAVIGHAAAQSPATTAPEAQATEGGLEEIVVTAQRREENLQDVPIAISAVTASVAEQLGVGDPQSVTQLVPGFTFQRQASGATPFIRGVGSTSSFIGNEPSVAVFVDDTYIPTGNAAIFEFNNVELVEVLKGPQGTLFGRNATGGVVHVHTLNPTHEPTLDASVGYGNFDTRTAQFYGSVGLSDTVAVNFAAFGVNQEDGWGDNVTSGGDVLTNESWGVRSKLLWEPTDETSVLVGAVLSNRKSDQGMAQQVAPGYRGFAGYDPDALGAGFYDGVTNRADEYYDTDFYQFNAKVRHDFSAASLVSITAYSKTDTFFAIDLDASPLNILNGDVTNYAHTFTQELQLLSPTDSKIQWIVGSFFLKDNSFFGLDAFGLGIPGVPAGSHNIEQARQRTTSI